MLIAIPLAKRKKEFFCMLFKRRVSPVSCTLYTSIFYTIYMRLYLYVYNLLLLLYLLILSMLIVQSLHLFSCTQMKEKKTNTVVKMNTHFFLYYCCCCCCCCLLQMTCALNSILIEGMEYGYNSIFCVVFIFCQTSLYFIYILVKKQSIIICQLCFCSLLRSSLSHFNNHNRCLALDLSFFSCVVLFLFQEAKNFPQYHKSYFNFSSFYTKQHRQNISLCILNVEHLHGIEIILMYVMAN